MRDNRWVVPHNPRLLNKFKCHLNVEICTSIKAVKYLYKYTYKGPDRAMMEIVNEVTEFLDARYVTAPEACWRLFEYPMHARSHVVERLPVHLEGEQHLVFENGKVREALGKAAALTKLTSYFKVSEERAAVGESKLKYTYVPNYYVWDTKNCHWRARQRQAKGGAVIGCMFQCSHKDPDLYDLRLILLHVAGIKGYPTQRESTAFLTTTNGPSVKLPSSADWCDTLTTSTTSLKKL